MRAKPSHLDVNAIEVIVTGSPIIITVIGNGRVFARVGGRFARVVLIAIAIVLVDGKVFRGLMLMIESRIAKPRPGAVMPHEAFQTMEQKGAARHARGGSRYRAQKAAEGIGPCCCSRRWVAWRGGARGWWVTTAALARS